MGGDGDAAPRIHPTALIEDGVTIGSRTCIWDHVHVRHGAAIGEECIIGEKTYIAYSVPDFHLALGSPARSVGCVCRCGHVLARFETDPPRRVTCSECSRCYEIADRNVTELTSAERERPLVTILTPAFNEADIVQANLQRIFEH